MKSGAVELRLSSDADQLKALMDELANDFEARANLSPVFFSFETTKGDTWPGEHWLIQVRGETVGFIYADFARAENKVSLEIAVNKAHRDKGAGAKAALLMLRYLFDVLGIRKLETDCHGFNLRAQKMYAAFLIPEGVRRASTFWAGRYWDRHLFGLTKADFEERRPRIERILRERGKRASQSSPLVER